MTESNEKWNFSLVFPGGGLGFNDGGTQLFKDDNIESLAREVCQNSIDAKQKNSVNPVEVEFNIFKMDKKDFPGYDRFKEIINMEYNYSKELYKNNDKPYKYYEEALKTLNSEEILCLRISDFNTTGLTTEGHKNNNNWSNLVVYSGTNDKNPEDGGSFGLGKNAMYTCSKLGCLFFSTLTSNGKTISEGVAKLSSFYISENSLVHGLGFYGDYDSYDSHEADKPMNKLCNLDKSFVRDTMNCGTDIYILGFEQNASDLIHNNGELSNFECKIMASIIDNYFVSILNSILVVRVNGNEINSNNIYDIFEKIYAVDKMYFNENTYDYLNVMKNDKIYPICIMNPNNEDAVLRIELNPNYHNRVAMIKNTGMKIMDKKNFPQIAIFSGVLILKTNEVNGYFKQMENPAHNDWVLSRIKNDKDVNKRYNNMLNQIKNVLKNLAKENIPEQMDIVGLGEYLPDDYDDSIDSNKKENITDELIEEIEVRDRIVLPKKYTNIEGNENEFDVSEEGVIDEEGNYDTSYGDGPENSTDRGNLSYAHSSNKEDAKLKIGKLMDKGIKRNCYFDSLLNEYVLSISFLKKYESLKLHIKIRGEQADYPAEVIYAYARDNLSYRQELLIKDGLINIESVNEKQTLTIYFKLEDADNCALEVDIYENKE